jgi:hypothetical protein
MRGCALVLIASMSFALAGSGAAAEPAADDARAEARKIGYAGVEAFQAGDFTTAHERLETAYRLLRVPSLGLWSARALEKLGKLVEADQRYIEVIKLPTSVGDEAIQEQARQDATRERGALARRISGIKVRVQGASIEDVAVTIDGVPLAGAALGESQPVNPGRHRVEGGRGATRADVEVDVAEGEQREATLAFGPAGSDTGIARPIGGELRGQPGPSTGGGPMRTVGWVTLGAGVAGLAVGGAAALIVRSKKNNLDGVGCGAGGQMCPASEAASVDSYNNWRSVPTISLVAGALLAGAGAYLVLTTSAAGETGGGAARASPSRTGRRLALVNVSLTVVPGGTMISGEF